MNKLKYKFWKFMAKQVVRHTNLPLIENCKFSGNTSIIIPDDYHSSFSISDCRFEGSDIGLYIGYKDTVPQILKTTDLGEQGE